MGREVQRAKLHQLVADHWGAEAAELVMDVIPPWDHEEIARKVDVENARLSLEASIANLRTETADLRTELKCEMAALNGEMAALNGEFAVLSGGLDARFERQFNRLAMANIGIMFGFASLLIAAAKFV